MAEAILPRGLRQLLLVTDLGFIIYWAVIILGLLPGTIAFPHYHDPTVQAWNWSFAPIDLTASGLGLLATHRAQRNDANARTLAVISLTLTATAGLMAIAFWAARGQFDLTWWIPNFALAIWPLGYLRSLTQHP